MSKSPSNLPDQIASSLRLLVAMILEDSLDHASSTIDLYAVAEFDTAAKYIATLTAAIDIVARWKERLRENEEPLD